MTSSNEEVRAIVEAYADWECDDLLAHYSLLAAVLAYRMELTVAMIHMNAASAAMITGPTLLEAVRDVLEEDAA